jgi:hypothetical protein
MTEKLKISIENLYKVFYKYPFKSKISGCPCCVSDSDRLTLHSKQLRDLQEDDISRYAFKAISTWGDIDDFKHYLPRIFELLSTTDFIVDTFVILGKLDYANWTDWEQEEQDAIIDFLYSWWTDFASNKDYFDREVLIEINKLTKDLPKLLDLWSIDIEKNSFKCFVDFLQSDFYNISQKTKYYKDLSDSELDNIIKWINKNIPKLEDGFFYYEKKDSEFAQDISNILYTIERV